MQDRLTKIYILKHPITEEVRYVGKTVLSLNERKAAHIYSAKSADSRYVCKWIRKLIREGLRPVIEEIDSCLFSESAELEIFYIKQYKDNNYKLTNLTTGGEGTLGFVIKPSYRTNMSIIKGNNGIIYKYTLKGEFIESFRSYYDAGKTIESPGYLIRMCCKNQQRKTCKGFIWSFSKPEEFNLPNNINKKSTTKGRLVKVTNTANNLDITTHKTMKEVAQLYNIPVRNIRRFCESYRIYNNYKFEFINDKK